MDDDEPWIPSCCLDAEVDENKCYITGWVKNEEDLQTVLEAHKRASLSTFVKWSDDTKKKQKTERRLLWKYQDICSNTPFCVERSVVLTCQYGKPRRKETVDNEETNTDSDHQYTKRKRFHIQTSKKVDCAAKLYIRYITRYPEYSVEENAGRGKRQFKLDLLTEHLVKKKPVEEKIMQVKLPLTNAHTNHTISPESGFSNSIHMDLKFVIRKNVEMGLTSIPYLRRVLREYVKTHLCNTNIVDPDKTDRSYYPTSRDIYNTVHTYLAAGQYSGLDQENLQHKIQEWEKSSDKFFFRACTGEEASSVTTYSKPQKVFQSDPDDEMEENDVDMEPSTSTFSNTFLLVHQTEQQQELMKKYGQLVLIDSTYKTSKYALPLFLVVVRTNVMYIPVAEFIVESETIGNITEALQVLKDWNKEWKPQYFMMDYSDIEYQACNNVFPDAKKYLCYFHVEQAWLRWTRKKKNNLTDTEAADFLLMMRNISKAVNVEEYEKLVTSLQQSDLFKQNENVRTYLDNFWLGIPERWCRAFLDIGFNSSVRTNNGVESLNSSLKNFYTKLNGTGSISSLMEIIVQDFIPDQLTTYRRLNFIYTSQYRQYNEHIPKYLHNLPRNVVKHCLLRFAAASHFSTDDFDEIATGIHLVKSEINDNIFYHVDLGSEDRLLSCSCEDFNKSFLPCKHIFAIIRHTNYSWNDISVRYRESPYLQLDKDFLSKPSFEINYEPEDQSELLDVALESTNELAVVPREEGLFRSRRKLRENIRILDEVSFLSQSSEAMDEASTVLDGLIANLKETVEKSENLPLHKGLTAKLTPKANRPLPLRRKIKPRTKKNSNSVILSVKEPSYSGVKEISACKNDGKRKTHIEKNSSKRRKTEDSSHAEETVDNCGLNIQQEEQDNDQTIYTAEPIYQEKQTENLKVIDVNDKVRRMEQAEQMIQQHLKAIHGHKPLNKADQKPRKVVISEEAIKFKQHKLQALQTSSPIYPGGGLLNKAGKNLCFANALFQCLRIADLHKLLQYHAKCTVPQTCFTCCLREFITDPPISAEPVCRQMTSFWPQYRVGVQQDSHELLQKIMNEVQENCFGTGIQEMAETKKIFYGQIQYTWICDDCKSESKKIQQFFDISVSITQFQTVTQAVEGFFLQERVEKNCNSCNNNTCTLTKKLVEIPKNIIIQLQRFNSAQRKVMKKLDLHFNLYLRSYVVEEKILEDKAELFAVIVHKGASLGNGHYFAIIKFGGQWYRVDDMKIDRVSLLSLNNLDGQAYILFYRALPRPYTCIT